VWKLLEGVKRGSFHVQVAWADLKTVMQPIGSGDLVDLYPHRGVLAVLVDSCSNLIVGGREHRVPSSAVRAELCGISQTTEPVLGTSNPVFSHRMSFLVVDPSSDTLKITVVDEKKGETMGTLRYVCRNLHLPLQNCFIDFVSILDLTSLIFSSAQTAP
jgi:hypothetical protein